MCGIAGIWNAGENVDALRAVDVMLRAMKHRGPDGSGSVRFAGGAAGMVRLALVDPTDRGQQPMWAPDKKTAILFNGEIYNFREERRRLESLGYRFHSTTDTEVALYLYLEHGLDFVERLRGMFAIAILDWRSGGLESPPNLLLTRGVFGIKPLYVGQVKGEPRSLVFSSEIKAMLASGAIERAIDRRAVAEYLSSGFVWQPRSILEGVRMLEPGTLELHEPGKPVRTKRFWHLPAYEPRHETLDQAAERLRPVLDESIRLHALADAPVGAFLSGGIDSTVIVGLMRQHVRDLRTYTLKFPEFPGIDESAEAAEAARYLEVKNTTVDVVGTDVARDLPRFARDLDQPSTDGLNTWQVSRAAARDVKGVLSGLGGDEWFAGYPVTRRMSRYSNTALGWTQSLAAQLASTMVDLVPHGSLRHRVANLAARRSPLSTWIHAHSVFDWSEIHRRMGISGGESTLNSHIEQALSPLNADWKHETPVGLSFLLDMRVFMGNQLLRDSDAASMAHSLELRVPFVDLDLVDFTRSCFDHHKLLPDGGYGDDYVRSGSKRVLIHAMQDVLPLSVAHRPKRGFVVPVYSWLRGALRPMVEELCSPESLKNRGLFDPELAAPSWKAFRDGKGKSRPTDREIWALLNLELWCREVFDAAPPVDATLLTSSTAQFN